MYRNRELSNQGTMEAVQAWTCLFIIMDNSFQKLSISSVNHLSRSQGHIQNIHFKNTTFKHQNSGHMMLPGGRGRHFHKIKQFSGARGESQSQQQKTQSNGCCLN